MGDVSSRARGGGGLPEINISKGLKECVIYFLGDDLRIVS
jgi:hypothetical protein